jgi:hypothetical protein
VRVYEFLSSRLHGVILTGMQSMESVSEGCGDSSSGRSSGGEEAMSISEEEGMEKPVGGLPGFLFQKKKKVFNKR